MSNISLRPRGYHRFFGAVIHEDKVTTPPIIRNRQHNVLLNRVIGLSHIASDVRYKHKPAG